MQLFVQILEIRQKNVCSFCKVQFAALGPCSIYQKQRSAPVAYTRSSARPLQRVPEAALGPFSVYQKQHSAPLVQSRSSARPLQRILEAALGQRMLEAALGPCSVCQKQRSAPLAYTRITFFLFWNQDSRLTKFTFLFRFVLEYKYQEFLTIIKIQIFSFLCNLPLFCPVNFSFHLQSKRRVAPLLVYLCSIFSINRKFQLTICLQILIFSFLVLLISHRGTLLH